MDPYATEPVPLAYVLPDSRFGANVRLLEVTDDDGLPEAVRAANEAVRDSAERFVLSLAPEAVPDSVEADFVTVSGRTDRLFVGDGVYSTLVTLSIRSGDGAGATVFLPVTVDLESGAAVRLGGLFVGGSDWREALAQIVRTAALAAVPGTEAAQLPNDPLGPNPAFTLGPDGLALHIPPGQIASEALHPEVAYGALARYAVPGGLVTRLGAE